MREFTFSVKCGTISLRPLVRFSRKNGFDALSLKTAIGADPDQWA
jgi:hypothetical protein